MGTFVSTCIFLLYYCTSSIDYDTYYLRGSIASGEVALLAVVVVPYVV